jgi:hypothetical protein
MTKNFFLIIIFLFCASVSFAQGVTFENIKKQYEAFQYDSVIKNSDQLLQKEDLSDSLKIEVYLMRADIFYQKNNDQLTRSSFEEILKLQKKYVPDPLNFSPKLIAIFNDVKTDFLRKNPDVIQQKDTSKVKPETKFGDPLVIRNARIQSILLPGLGQLYIGYKTKGWIESAVSIANLGALVYFYLDANKKEKNYLSESDLTLIQQRYDDYNKSYKTRNLLLITYAALLIYSQLDLTFFSDEPPLSISLNEASLTNSHVSLNNIQLNFKVHF